MNRRRLGALIVQAGGAAVVAATIPTKIASALAEKPNALSITPAEVGRQVIWTDGLQAPTLAVLTADGVEAAYAANPHHPEIAAAYAKLMRGELSPYPWKHGTAEEQLAALADYRLEVTQPLDAAYYGQSLVPPEATAFRNPQLLGRLSEDVSEKLKADPFGFGHPPSAPWNQDGLAPEPGSIQARLMDGEAAQRVAMRERWAQLQQHMRDHPELYEDDDDDRDPIILVQEAVTAA